MFFFCVQTTLAYYRNGKAIVTLFLSFFSRKRRANPNPRPNKNIATALVFGHFFGGAAGRATLCGP